MSSQRDLARRLAREGAAGFEPVVRASERRLYRVALRILGRAADAEDAVQEAFLRAYDALLEGRYDERLRMEAWLIAIVSRVSIDMLRRRAVRAPADVELELLSELDTQAARRGSLDEATLHGVLDVARWLQELPPDQRAAIVLRFMEDLTNAEVALALGVSEGAVEQRIIRARASLRRRES